MKRSSALIAVPLLAVATWLVGAAPAVADACSTGCETSTAAEEGSGAKASAKDPARAAQELLQLVNQERTSRGLAALTMRADVVDIATGHSQAMAEDKVLRHNDHYFTAETRRRLDAKVLAENVAYNGDVADMHRRLMASESHRQNILDARFTVVGIAMVHDGQVWWGTQGFVQPTAATSAPAPTPAPAPAPTPAPAAPAAAPASASAPAPAPAPATPAAAAMVNTAPAGPVTVSVQVAPPTPGADADGRVVPRSSGDDVEVALSAGTAPSFPPRSAVAILATLALAANGLLLAKRGRLQLAA